MPDLKLSYRVIVTTNTTEYDQYKNRHVKQQKREKRKPQSYSQVVFGKGVKHRLWRNDGFFKVWENYIL